MKTNPNDPINISFKELGESANPGLTKREYFSGLAFQAVIAKIPLHDSKGTVGIPTTKEDNWKLYLDVAESACRYADALIEQLNKVKS